jgi:polyvinyl alcohol dehydrogenase (cytochrome)
MTISPHSNLRQRLEFAQRIAALLVSIVLVACSSATPAAVPAARATGSWFEYRGDPARDGHPSGSTLNAQTASRLKLAWRTRLDGAVDGSPAVWQGLVFAATAGGTLAALDSANGKTVWARHGLGAIAGSPTIAGDRVLVGTLTGRAYSIRVEDGGVIWEWQAPTNATIWASPVAYRDVVIVGIASPYGDTPLVPGRLAGLDLMTGHERWNLCVLSECRPGDGVWSTPAIDERGVAFVGIGNPDDGVLAFDPLTGARRWLSSFYADQGRDLDVGASPIIFRLGDREVVAEATVQGLLAVLDAQSGATVWSRPIVEGTAVHGLLASPAYDGMNIYAPSASPPTGIFALRASDGAPVWRHGTALSVYSAPAIGQGVLLFGTGAVLGDLNAGSVVALSTEDGHLLWSYDTRSAVRSGPALAGEDFVVLGDYAGDVLAFRPRL